MGPVIVTVQIGTFYQIKFIFQIKLSETLLFIKQIKCWQI